MPAPIVLVIRANVANRISDLDLRVQGGSFVALSTRRHFFDAGVVVFTTKGGNSGARNHRTSTNTTLSLPATTLTFSMRWWRLSSVSNKIPSINL